MICSLLQNNDFSNYKATINLYFKVKINYQSLKRDSTVMWSNNANLEKYFKARRPPEIKLPTEKYKTLTQKDV